MTLPARIPSPNVLPQSAVGRADLLRALWLADQHAHSERRFALAAGYVQRFIEGEEDEGEGNDEDQQPPQEAQGKRDGAAERRNPAQTEIPRARFWAVTERVTLKVAASDDDRQERERIPLVPSDLLAGPDSAAPIWQHIAPTARLMPALKRSLQAQRTGELDIDQLVYTLAHGKTLRRLPRRALKGWTDRLLVVLDLSEPLLPYRIDMHQLACDLRRWVGHSNVKVRVINDEHHPLGPWLEWNLDAPVAQRSLPMLGRGWVIGVVASRVLLVSEMGLVARDGGKTTEAWAAWLHELGKQGADLQVWCPLPIGLPSAPEEAPSGWQRAAATMPRVPVMHWSAGNRLRLRSLPTADLHRTPERIAVAKQLRTRLATVARVEPSLLRALRLGMGSAALDAGLEHLAWDHPDMSRHYSARTLNAASLATYRAGFNQLPSRQTLQVLDAVLAHHSPCNPLLAHVETLAWAAYATPEERRERQVEVSKALDVMQRFAHDPWQVRQLDRAEVLDFVARHLRDADAPTRALCSPYMSQLMVALHREREGDEPLTESLEGLAAADVAKALGNAQPPQPFWLALNDEHGWLMLTKEKPADSRLLAPQTVEVQGLSIHMGHRAPRWEKLDPHRDIALARLPWGSEERQIDSIYKWLFAPFPPPLVDGPIRLDTGLETIAIEEIPRPSWALEWARDRQGLYALAPNPWGPALRVSYPLHASALPGILVRLIEFDGQSGTQLDTFTLDLDAIGLIARLTVNGRATQAFRYLPPGQFVMGSPDSELGRSNDEDPQHPVTLTEALWLADTACTQGLWQAVMGDKNPSHFTGDPDLPVENVSWYGVRTFLSKLKAFLPTGTKATLPTEAQWEYACRAGTTTPFALGDQITTDQVNYDGNYPYNSGSRGEDRRKTVPVKALPANAWGLYQMHGNVLEWCADTMRSYTGDAVINPRGATGKGGESFAVRGGSWYVSARFVRSARRQQIVGNKHHYYLGFRFALRFKGGQGVWGSEPQGGSTSPDQNDLDFGGTDHPVVAASESWSKE